MKSLRIREISNDFTPLQVNMSPHRCKLEQETAKGGMTGLQRDNIIGKDLLRTNINAEVNIKYCMTLNR